MSLVLRVRDRLIRAGWPEAADPALRRDADKRRRRETCVSRLAI